MGDFRLNVSLCNGGIGFGMKCKIGVLFGDERTDPFKLCVPVLFDLPFPYRVPSEYITDTLMNHFREFVLEEIHLKDALLKERPDLGLGNGGDVPEAIR